MMTIAVTGIGAPHAPVPVGPRSFTRAELIRLGPTRSPWEYVPPTAEALRVAPDDAGLRLLLAAGYAKLGLATPAREELSKLPEEARTDENVRQLAETVERLGLDRIPWESRAATCRVNVEALADREIDLRAEVEAWLRASAGTDALRASDGNIVLRRGQEWVRFRDDLGEARRAVLPHQVEGHTGPIKPYIVEGAFPPWLLLRVVETTGRAADGYQPRITVLQADAPELLEGLSLADLRAVIGQERVEFIVGTGAPERLRALLMARLDLQVVGPVVVVTAGVRIVAMPRATQVLAEVGSAQREELARLRERVSGIYAGRDRPWWRTRYGGDGPDAGKGKPLRVLIPTCLYTTFVRHSAADLARAFERTGWEARVLIEPNDRSHLSGVAYLRAIAEFEPDLIVIINYTRAHFGDLLPTGVPFVCWVQDAMPHLFSTEAGRSQTQLDFLVGHVHRELYQQHGYPLKQMCAMPVVASAEKFHARPVEAGLARRMECEIALVTHHSETPEAMHARLVREVSREPAVARVLERLRATVLRMARRPEPITWMDDLDAAVLEASRAELGPNPPQRALTLIRLNYCVALADRAMRHQTLEWAAQIARRRGWRLRIYGRGWKSHPTLGELAAGELAHGEELRAAYQCAGVLIHASLTEIVHQRVMECALSGGLPVCRLTTCALSMVHSAVRRAAYRETGIHACDIATRRVGVRAADSADVMALMALRQRLGLEAAEFEWFNSPPPGVMPEPTAPERRPDWLLGDMSELTFNSAEGLEQIVERALARPAWRSAWSTLVASRVRRRLTHPALVERMVDLIRRSLTRGAEGESTR